MALIDDFAENLKAVAVVVVVGGVIAVVVVVVKPHFEAHFVFSFGPNDGQGDSRRELGLVANSEPFSPEFVLEMRSGVLIYLSRRLTEFSAKKTSLSHEVLQHDSLGAASEDCSANYTLLAGILLKTSFIWLFRSV